MAVAHNRTILPSPGGAEWGGCVSFVQVFAGCCATLAGADGCAAPTSPISKTCKDIGQALPVGFEPSDAVWQPRSQRLLLVSDEGMIAEMDTDGGSLRTWPLEGDLEGITITDPASDRVYVLIERPPAIV